MVFTAIRSARKGYCGERVGKVCLLRSWVWQFLVHSGMMVLGYNGIPPSSCGRAVPLEQRGEFLHLYEIESSNGVWLIFSQKKNEEKG